MSDTVKVKLTMFPDPIEVPADELPALRAQGLVEETPEQPSAPASIAVKVTASTKDAS